MVLCAQHRIFTKGSVLHPITPYTARHGVGNMAQTWHCMHCSAADARQCRFTSGIKWVGFKSFSLLLKTEKGNKDSFYGSKNGFKPALHRNRSPKRPEPGRFTVVPPWVFHGFPVAKSRPCQGEEGEAAEFRVGWMDKWTCNPTSKI